MRKWIAIAALVVSVNPAPAAEWVIGLGATDFSSGRAMDESLIELEVHASPFWTKGALDVSLGGAFVTHANGDFWIGGGLSARFPFAGNWFVEGSIMPGLYDEAFSGNDLGSAFEIRSLIGIGYRLSDKTDLSLAISHKSNAGTSSTNPGVNALTLRMRLRF